MSRGFIGVTLTDVTPALGAGPAVAEGAMVQDVTPRSPAERAGLRPYDVIVEVEGRRVTSNEELIRYISARQPGTVAKLDVLREGRRQTMRSSWPSGQPGARTSTPRRGLDGAARAATLDGSRRSA